MKTDLEDDPDYLEGWQTEGDFYWIDATITPQDPAAKWDASVLTLVPGDWKGSPGMICEEIGPLHSIELYDGRKFRLLHNGEEELLRGAAAAAVDGGA